MKIKFVRFIAFSLLTAALFGGLNWRYMHTYHYQSMDGYFLYESMPQTLDIVNFGSSHARNGIDYRPHPEYNAFNFAFAAQCPDVDWMLFQSYEDRFSDDCVVVLPISFFAPYNPDGTYSRVRYTKYLKPQVMPDYRFKDALLYKYLPVLSSQEYLLKCFEAPNENDLLYGYQQFGIITMQTPEEDREWEAEAIVNAAWIENYMQGQQQLQPRQVDALLYMLDRCREKGWQAVVITPPIPAYTQKYLPEDFLPTFYSDMQQILSAYPEVPFWDYARDPAFKDHPELFADADHLNEDGNRLFTDRLLADCQAAGYLAP